MCWHKIAINFDFAQIPRKIAPENSHNLTAQEPKDSTLLCGQNTNLSVRFDVAADDDHLKCNRKGEEILTDTCVENTD